MGVPLYSSCVLYGCLVLFLIYILFFTDQKKKYIEKILKLLSTMPTRRRPRRELIYYFVDGCMMPRFHLMR